MSNKTTVEIIPAADLKEGDTILRDGGDTVTVGEIVSRGSQHVSFREEGGGPLPFYASRSVLRVVPEQPEEPAEKAPEWPDVPFIRIIRGTEYGRCIDGSHAVRRDDDSFILIDGPNAGHSLCAWYDGDAIFEWEEVVPVSKSAVLAGLDTPTEDNEPANDDTDDAESEDEDEEECDGSCPFCTFMRLIATAANRREPEEATE
jgi:hypothetical protein